ncbi:MAG: hypothetical protein E6R04_04080 [Spirochaetes bacterium]|nr:MAG: hypothetical protein E6R04_04080 [Spirochaetota bacterium]
MDYEDLKPKKRYHFELMSVNATRSIDLSKDKDAGLRALRAAYLYGKRTGKKFMGRTLNGCMIIKRLS